MKEWIQLFIYYDNGWEIKERIKTFLFFILWMGVITLPIIILYGMINK